MVTRTVGLLMAAAQLGQFCLRGQLSMPADKLVITFGWGPCYRHLQVEQETPVSVLQGPGRQLRGAGKPWCRGEVPVGT